jgi:quinone-modifying oxidoreductase subunit QmoA
MKQASYVREQYPDAEIHLFYIDVRSPGRNEDFYVKIDEDEKTHFHRGKVAEVKDASGRLKVAAENTITGDIAEYEVDMVVLATGMVPSTAFDKPPIEGVELDENGFIVDGNGSGIIGAGTVVRPVDVAASVQDATGAAVKAMQMQERR